MADELQLTLKARDELTNQVKNSIKQIARLEAAIKEATTAASPESAREIDKLTRQLKTAQSNSQRLTSAVGELDHKVDALGGSASDTARDLERMGRETKTSASAMDRFKGAMGKTASVAAIAAASIAAVAIATKQVADAAINYEAKVRRTQIVFRGSTREVLRWARKNKEAFGGSTADVAAYAASIGDILKPLGFTSDEAAKLVIKTGDLVPALTEWNTAGMDATAVTTALTAALTGERDSLKQLGIVINEEDVKAKVKAMEAAGKFTDETEKQKEALATLKLITQGSADALYSYNNNQDSAGRKMKSFQSQIADLRDNGLAVFLETWESISAAFKDADLGNPIKKLAKFLKNNKHAIVAWILRFSAVFASFIAVMFKWESVVLGVIGTVIRSWADLLDVMALVNPMFKAAAIKAHGVADKFGGMSDAANDASVKAQELATSLWGQSNAAQDAQEKADLYREALQKLTKKKWKVVVGTVAEGFVNLGVGAPVDSSDGSGKKKKGDTTVGMGAGYLGPDGLTAAHAFYSSALAGHSITSGLRTDHLGSVHSDHRYGRAMDVHGPRLGAYAQMVRRNGGYAAMHGTGGGRHLHVVPQTRKPGPRAGNTFNAQVTVNNPRQEMDIEAAVARGLRAAARQTEERGA